MTLCDKYMALLMAFSQEKKLSRNLVVAKLNNTTTSENIASVINVDEDKLTVECPNSYNQIIAYLKVNLEAGKTYTLSYGNYTNYIKDVENSKSTFRYGIYGANGRVVLSLGNGIITNPRTFTLPQNAPNELSFYIHITNSFQGGNRKIIFDKLMINEGTEPLSFEPYIIE